jgi:dihydrofolate reductase
MRKIISFMHMSLDGFVAGPNGEMDWIKVDQDIFDHVGRRIGSTDSALYGRVTFQMMEGYWPTAADKPNASRHDIEHSKWYATARKIVLSKTLKGADFVNTEIIDGKISDRIMEIKKSSGGGSDEILLFGSPTATHSLAAFNLIDGYWLFVNPIILGRGIPLFSGIKDRIKLDLQSTQRFACGVTELNYTLVR